MRKLTKEILYKGQEKRTYRKVLSTCKKNHLSSEITAIIMSIYAIEHFYRYWGFRMVEYFAGVWSGVLSIVFKRPMRNYTIGVCQLGLSTIRNYYGASYYQHSMNLQLNCFQDLREILSVMTIKNSVRILTYRIAPFLEQAQHIYPHSRENQLCYIGEQFNGRYSYGLMLNEVYEILDMQFSS